MRALAPWESEGLAALQPRPLAGGVRGEPEGPRPVDSAFGKARPGPQKESKKTEGPLCDVPKGPPKRGIGIGDPLPAPAAAPVVRGGFLGVFGDPLWLGGSKLNHGGSLGPG